MPGAEDITEQAAAFDDLDLRPTGELLAEMVRSSRSVAEAVERSLPQLAPVIDAVTDALTAGGRLIYVGAGTSGRLALIDALECPPTFGVAPGRVLALIPGGEQAVCNLLDEPEDDEALGRSELSGLQPTPDDVVIGVSASGRTPYVLGALRAARAHGARTVAIACNEATPLAAAADLSVLAVVGPELVSGSTRLNAGSAQKLILNMISTASMIRLGKVYRNLMVDLMPTNAKLRERAVQIVARAAQVESDVARQALLECGSPKAAIVRLLAGATPEAAKRALADAQGNIRAALAALARPDEA
ncbi:MAG TPA: N-acetylmuramic acid 6-phosphate etherase [Limnochordia bacterium]|nr:N-acetylmuramic acid 6-phosphate etherase [Limnochordia bacterium]